MVEDKVIKFLDDLEKRGIEISEDTAFLCNDGVVLLLVKAGSSKVDIVVVRKPVKIDYTLGITDNEVNLWKSAADLMSALGGGENE